KIQTRIEQQMIRALPVPNKTGPDAGRENSQDIPGESHVEPRQIRPAPVPEAEGLRMAVPLALKRPHVRTRAVTRVPLGPGKLGALRRCDGRGGGIGSGSMSGMHCDPVRER